MVSDVTIESWRCKLTEALKACSFDYSERTDLEIIEGCLKDYLSPLGIGYRVEALPKLTNIYNVILYPGRVQIELNLEDIKNGGSVNSI